MFNLLHKQHHYIITGEGITTISYGATVKQTCQGIGQGSTVASIIWLFVSSLLFRSMQEWATGLTWTDPTGNPTTSRKADVYVNDATLWTNQHNNMGTLKQNMKTDLEKYQRSLTYTGGTLTLHKGFLTSSWTWEAYFSVSLGSFSFNPLAP